MTEAELSEEIVKQVTIRWNAAQLPMLLATLGSENGNAISNAIKFFGYHLRQFIEEKLSDNIAIIRHSTRKQLIGAIPKGVQIEDEDGLLERVSAHVAKLPRKPRYIPEFWYAFQNPIAEHCRRIVVGGAAPRVQDISQDAELPVDGLEISAEYVVGPEKRMDRDQIYAAINRWLKDFAVRETDFIATTRKPTEREQFSRKPETILSALFDSLSDDQLRRISMPLDIVARLFYSRIR